MLPFRDSVVTQLLSGALALLAAVATASGQTPVPNQSSLALKASIVLTAEFCAATTKQKYNAFNSDTFEIGEAVCAELEPALKGVFLSLNRVATTPSPGEAQVVLLPRVVDFRATAPFSFHREMIVLLEWTVKDASGRTAWMGTMKGDAKGPTGSTFTREKNRKLLLYGSVKDAAKQSASAMSSALELRNLAEHPLRPAQR